MGDLNIRPLLAHEPEATPPWRWGVLLAPVVMAVVGILVATGSAIAGQDARRDREKLENDKGRFYWENELAQAQLRHEDSEKIAKLEGLVKEYRDRKLSPYTEPGRHFTEWDGVRYEEILTEGYAYHVAGDSAEVKRERMIMRPGWPEKRVKDVVWFPLYPMLAWGVMKGLGISATAALTVVAEGCLVLGAVVMFLFARRHFYNRVRGEDRLRPELLSGETAAMWSVAVLLFGPCSVFLYANFTESLFVLLLAAFLYCLQGRWWWRAALVAAVASACRSQGALFGPTLAVAFLLRSDVRNWAVRVGIAAVLGMASTVGLGCYMLYLQMTFGDPLAFVHAQSYWHVGLGMGSIYQALNPINALTHFVNYAWYTSPMDWPRLWEASCVIWPPVVLLVLGGRYLSFEMELLGWMMWGLPYVSNSLAGFPEGSWAWMSMGRYMSVLIPAYIVAGAVLARVRWLGVPFLAGWAAAFGIFAYKFGAGEWVG